MRRFSFCLFTVISLVGTRREKCLGKKRKEIQSEVNVIVLLNIHTPKIKSSPWIFFPGRPWIISLPKTPWVPLNPGTSNGLFFLLHPRKALICWGLRKSRRYEDIYHKSFRDAHPSSITSALVGGKYVFRFPIWHFHILAHKYTNFFTLNVYKSTWECSENKMDGKHHTPLPLVVAVVFTRFHK